MIQADCIFEKKAKMTKLENALVWLYVKTWGKFADHVIAEKALWNFGSEDLETAIMGLAFPRKNEKAERVQALTDLIMEKFEQDGMAFREWVVKIHEQVQGFTDRKELVPVRFESKPLTNDQVTI